MNVRDRFPLGLTGLISLQSKELSRVFSNTTIQKHPFSNSIILVLNKILNQVQNLYIIIYLFFLFLTELWLLTHSLLPWKVDWAKGINEIHIHMINAVVEVKKSRNSDLVNLDYFS